MLFYTTYPALTNDDFFYTTHRRNWIEIFPRGKLSFDILSFIDFSDSLTENFICTEFTSYRDVISIKARHCSLKDEAAKSIWISITDNYSRVNVYLKDGFNQFKRLKEDNKYYIVTEMISNDEDNLLNFSSNGNLSKYLSHQDSIIYVFGKHVANGSVNSPLFLKISFKNFLCPKTQLQRQNPLPANNDLYGMVQSLPGQVLLKCKNTSEVCI